VGARGQAPSVLRAGTDLVTIDVQITAARGTSIREFTPADFAVDISGRRRPLASATLLHYDGGEVVPNPGRTSDSGPACAFGFHRKKDLRTVHYLLAVERTASDAQQVKQVKVTLLDKAFEIQTYAWRSPIYRSLNGTDTVWMTGTALPRIVPGSNVQVFTHSSAFASRPMGPLPTV